MAKLVSKLTIIADGIDGLVGEVLDETATFILSIIRILVPVDTGTLRESYEIDKESLLHIIIGSGLSYSIYQEYGTSTQSGTPHVTPAFVLGRDFLVRRLKQKLEANYS